LTVFQRQQIIPEFEYFVPDVPKAPCLN